MIFVADSGNCGDADCKNESEPIGHFSKVPKIRFFVVFVHFGYVPPCHPSKCERPPAMSSRYNPKIVSIYLASRRVDFRP